MAIVPVFSASYATIQRERLQNNEIKNRPWGGRDPVLDTPEKQLLFTLFYLKSYPTFDVLGFHFGLSAGHARDYLGRSPISIATLVSEQCSWAG